MRLPRGICVTCGERARGPQHYYCVKHAVRCQICGVRCQGDRHRTGFCSRCGPDAVRRARWLHEAWMLSHQRPATDEELAVRLAEYQRRAAAHLPLFNPPVDVDALLGMEAPAP